MPNTSPFTPESDQKLFNTMWSPQFAEDPEAWIMFTFPWGKAGTPLANKKGLRKWQREECKNIREHIQMNKWRIANGQEPVVYKFACTSGRGTGKSAFVAMITLWLMSVVPGIAIVLTANTESQLKDKTMAELGKWHTMAINSHWFDKTAMSLRPSPWFEELLKKQLKIDTAYYYVSAQLWSETNPDAFAGLHNEYGILLIFDEASGIPNPIWNVSDGFFTELSLHRYWFVFSNPRRNTGMFFECFHKLRKFWKRRKINSLEVEESAKQTYLEIIEKNGADSDEARVEVFGEFPKQSSNQFISRGVVENAVSREVNTDPGAPLIMGVDPARFGDDSTVICFRRGRDARSIKWEKMDGCDNMAVANMCAKLIDEHNPDAVCIDVGNGTGIIDRLREMKYVVHEVAFGSASGDDQYANHRTEIWGKMRDWLVGGAIPNDEDLTDDLVGPNYTITNKDQTMLEPKDKMKARGLSSPDNADALACTFSVRIARSDTNSRKRKRRARQADGMNDSVYS